MPGIRTMVSGASSTLANSEQYLAITGHQPPHTPPTAKDYTSAGLPWFDYYSDSKALVGSDTLGKLTSVAAKVIEKGKDCCRTTNRFIQNCQDNQQR